MQHWQPRDATTLSDPEYQEHALQGVSRTFALTIPQLPPALRDAVGNTYLLCRIADTIEDDPERGACWLPGELFARHGVDLARLGRDPYDSRFGAALAEMVGLAHDHLRDGLRYTLMIPAGERGLRRFCLYALGMALMTLRMIHRHPDFRAGATVRISRAVVRAVVTASRAAAGHDRPLVWLFALAARGLPRTAAPAAIGA